MGNRMDNNESYIKLPTIRSIEVKNYKLFSKDWSYNVKNGLNLFLGANGIGKTTSAYMVVYGIIGLWEDITSDYFIDREHPLLKNNNNADIPTVKVGFNVGDQSISVERQLNEPVILNFSVGDKQFTNNGNGNIEKLYKKELLKLFSVGSIDDIVFLLTKLLIREEEGNYLLWNKQDQSKIIRLLLNYSNFQQEFKKLEDKVTEFDTGVRGQQDIQHQFRERQRHIIDQKNEVIKQGGGITSKVDLMNLIQSKKESVSTFQNQKERNLDDLSYLKEEIKSFNNKIDTISAEVDISNDEIIALENTFYESVYSNPKVSLSSHKLKNYQICMFCTNKISQHKADEITHSIEDIKQCPVCNSNIGITPKRHKKISKDINERLLGLRKKVDEMNHQLKLYESKKKSVEDSFNELWAKQEKIDNDLNKATLDLYDLKLKLSVVEKGGDEHFTQYDRDINVLQEQIDYYQKIIDKKKDAYKKAMKKLINKNEQLNQKINDFIEKLNESFSRYAATFFRGDCKLVPYEGRRLRDSKVKLTTYCPEYEGKIRPYQNSTSKSEGIFLEYLFRMALLELYFSLTSSAPFLMLETSEGVFDVSGSQQLADALSAFGKNKFPFIAITNLSKPDFIRNMVKEYTAIKRRTLNFLDFGFLSDEQKKHKEYLNKALKTLSL